MEKHLQIKDFKEFRQEFKNTDNLHELRQDMDGKTMRARAHAERKGEEDKCGKDLEEKARRFAETRKDVKIRLETEK